MKSTGHIGVRECEIFVPGITGGIPFNHTFNQTGCNISGTEPIELLGPHVYLIEWSASINPVDPDATILMRVLLDDKPVQGSENFTDFTAKVEGFADLSGGAIVKVRSGVHELRLEAITGEKGAVAINPNVRIVQII
ncbi:MAG: hypothetical protein H9893_01665 [Candidatus Niameybacter stercoravium]|nr:hypothetical protein [Candidatus Niameybacter stercoravium]